MAGRPGSVTSAGKRLADHGGPAGTSGLVLSGHSTLSKVLHTVSVNAIPSCFLWKSGRALDSLYLSGWQNLSSPFKVFLCLQEKAEVLVQQVNVKSVSIPCINPLP